MPLSVIDVTLRIGCCVNKGVSDMVGKLEADKYAYTVRETNFGIATLVRDSYSRDMLCIIF